MKKTILFALCVIIATIAINAYYYPQMPSQIATHWNYQGEADAFTEKSLIEVFIIPLISVGVLALFIVIPYIDPLAKNIRQFMKYYLGFIIVFAVFMFYLNILMIYYNLGNRINMSQYLAPAFGLMFYYMGVLVGHAKKNWSVGIRTPWTLSNDKVWEKTHKLGGKLFKIAGIIAFIGLFFPDNAILFVVAPVVAFAVALVAYSFIEYRKIVKSI